jgi:PTH1 family peptidyl-tRNA hydrolase
VKIIVGLGNPGTRYRDTRHNIGFQIVDRFAESHGISATRRRFKSFYGRGLLLSHEIVLIKPLTFMNLSGEAVKRAADFFRAPLDDITVVHDDLDLPFGRLRFKRRGGDGGHQGVGSIIEFLGGNAFVRLKVGIGRPPRGMDPADYVLTTFDTVEQDHLKRVLSRAAESLTVMISEGLEMAMSRFQQRVTPLSQSP